MVLHFDEITDGDRLIRLERISAEIRKTLMGTILLAKDLYKNELLKSREGKEVMMILEEAEDAFVDTSLTNGLARLENVLDVIYKRSKGLYALSEHLVKHKHL